MKQIVIEIESGGKVKIDAIGFKGEACTKATAAVESALGKRTGGAKKPEWQQKDVQQQGQ